MDNIKDQQIRKLEEQLEDTNEKLKILLDNIPAGVISYEVLTGKFNFISKSCLDLFGCSELDFREHYYNSFEVFIFKEDRHKAKEMILAQSEFMTTIEVTFRVKDLMDEIRYMEFRGHQMKDRTNIVLIWATLTDVTERVAIQREIQRMSEELYLESLRYKLLEEAVDDIPFDYDVQLNVMQITLKIPKKETLLIKEFKQLEKFRDFIHPDDIVEVMEIWDTALIEQKKGTLECRVNFDTTTYRENMEDISVNLEIENYPGSRELATRKSDFIWCRIYYASFKDKSEKVIRIVGTIKDISKEHQEKENLKEIIRYDALTGILNKSTIQNAVIEVITRTEQDRQHALFVIDADNFKAINDNLGHMYGDTVIQFVARTIKKTFRDTDLVGRIGGDEFMVLMRGATLEAAEAKARALNSAMRQTFEKDGISIQISCSIGIAFYSKDGKDYDMLFTNADSALYEAKNMGRDRYYIW